MLVDRAADRARNGSGREREEERVGERERKREWEREKGKGTEERGKRRSRNGCLHERSFIPFSLILTFYPHSFGH